MADRTDPPQRPSGWRKRLLVLAALLATVLLLVAYLLPYLLKRYIEAHSVEWIGRTIRIERIVLDPFTFTYAVKGLVCHEPNSDEVFVSWDKVQVKADLWSGWRNKRWRFHQLRLTKPYVHITQAGDRFNFSDLIERSTGDATVQDPADTVPVVFSMEDIRIVDGRVAYGMELLKEPVVVRDLNASCTRITSENARMDFDLAFAIDQGGTLKGGFMIDTDSSLYAIRARLSDLQLPQLLPYLQDLMHTTALRGKVDLDLRLRDSWVAENELAVGADLTLEDLEVTDGQGEALIGLSSAQVHLDTLIARSGVFDLHSVTVDGFHTRFRMWADGSQTWGKVLKLDSTATDGDTTVSLAVSEDNVFVMLADYVRLLGQNLVANEYNADSLVFSNGELIFEDFTPERPFRYTLSGIEVRSTRMRSDAGSVDFQASAVLNGTGRLVSEFKFDPKNFRNVDATMAVDDLALADLDAYGQWYAAHPLLGGSLSYAGHTRIQDGFLGSTNHLQARQMKVGRKVPVHAPDIYVLPLRLAVGLLKDVKGNIDLDVPVEGDINDPKFKPWPIIWQVLKNLLVKAVTAPGRLIGRAFGGGDGADLEQLRFAPLSAHLDASQQAALTNLAKGLGAKPDLVVAFVPLNDTAREAEELATFEVKRQFLNLGEGMTARDTSRILALSTRDSSFVRFLDQRHSSSAGQGERQRCLAIFGPALAAQRVQAMERVREDAVRAFLGPLGLAPQRFSFRAAQGDEVNGMRGDPGYKFIFAAGDEAGDPASEGVAPRFP